MINNIRYALLFRLGALVFALTGLLKQIGVFQGSIRLGAFMYYTTLSNMLAIILFAILSAHTIHSFREKARNKKERYSRFEMACVVNLLVTFIVFWTLLVPQGISADYLWTFENLAVHAVTPLLCFIDFILFAEAWRLKYRDIYYTTIFPLLYAAFATVAGFAGYIYYYIDPSGNPIDHAAANSIPVRFPYFFLDYDQIGAMVGVYMIVILLAVLLLSHGIYYGSRKLQKPRSRNE